MNPPSLVIVGGGVFGITTALAMRARHWHVTLLDQGSVPFADAASTDISKVVRMDYGTDEIYTEMGEQALDGWCRWNATWEKPLYHADGFLVMTTSAEMRVGSFEHDSFHFLKQREHDMERIRPAELAARFPQWCRDRYLDGYFNPNGGWAESEKVMARLKKSAKEQGVVIREGCCYKRLLEKGSRVTGVRTTDSREWKADFVLATLGAWTPFFFPEWSPFLSVSGQPILHLKPEKPEAFRAPRFPVWGADIAKSGWYGFPANAEGIVKVANHGPGVKIHEPSQPRVVTPAEIDRFRSFVEQTFPQLASAQRVATRQCWYCDSVDGHFWIDHVPDRPGLILATGDSGHAFKFAPVLGGLISDVIENKPNSWSHRFQWRKAPAASPDAARAR